MPLFDRPTLYLLVVMLAAMSAVLLVTVWRINPKMPGLAWWAGAASLGGLGLVLLPLFPADVPPTGLAPLLRGSLLFAATLMLLEGTLCFMLHPSQRRWRIGLLAPPVFTALSWLAMAEPITLLVFQDSIHALLLLGCAMAMLRPSRPDERLVNTISAFLMLGMAAVLTMRAGISAQIKLPSTLALHPIHDLVCLALMLFLMGWTYCVHMGCYLRSQRTARDLQREESITTLPGPSYLEEVLRQEIARSQRTGLRFSYLLIDIDELRRANGLQASSMDSDVLRAFGMRLRQFARDADFACHLGEDKFVILLHHTPSQDHLRGAISRLRQNLLTPLQLKQASAQLEVNIGMAMWPVDGLDQSALASIAMQRMQAEKFSMFKPSLESRSERESVASV